MADVTQLRSKRDARVKPIRGVCGGAKLAIRLEGRSNNGVASAAHN